MTFLDLDVTQDESLRALVTEVIERHGRIHVLTGASSSASPGTVIGQLEWEGSLSGGFITMSVALRATQT